MTIMNTQEGSNLSNYSYSSHSPLVVSLMLVAMHLVGRITYRKSGGLQCFKIISAVLSNFDFPAVQIVMALVAFLLARHSKEAKDYQN
jgi:hypothetical protein